MLFRSEERCCRETDLWRGRSCRRTIDQRMDQAGRPPFSAYLEHAAPRWAKSMSGDELLDLLVWVGRFGEQAVRVLGRRGLATGEVAARFPEICGCSRSAEIGLRGIAEARARKANAYVYPWEKPAWSVEFDRRVEPLSHASWACGFRNKELLGLLMRIYQYSTRVQGPPVFDASPEENESLVRCIEEIRSRYCTYVHRAMQLDEGRT